MTNPFRNPLSRKQFDQCLEMYETKHRNFFLPDGSPHRNNSFAAAFWAGYNGLKTGLWDYSSNKAQIDYIFYRAGQEVKKGEE